MASADKGKKQSAGSLLPGEQQPEELPQSFSIGTKRAYDRGYEYPYKKQKIDMETVYVCNKGSDNAQDNEVLVLRRKSDCWIAYDSLVTDNELECRRQVFRSFDDKITKEGVHKWQMNKSLNNKGREVHEPDWFGELRCFTKVPKKESSE